MKKNIIVVLAVMLIFTGCVTTQHSSHQELSMHNAMSELKERYNRHFVIGHEVIDIAYDDQVDEAELKWVRYYTENRIKKIESKQARRELLADSYKTINKDVKEGLIDESQGREILNILQRHVDNVLKDQLDFLISLQSKLNN